MKKKDEPNFYKLDQSNPLPAIHDAPIPGAAATVQAMRTGASQSVSQHNALHSNLSPMTNQHGNNIVVTPQASPNHAGAEIIGESSSYHMANINVGHMNGTVSNRNGIGSMNGMGSGNMSMGNMSAMGHGYMNAMGHGNMNALGHGNMNAMGHVNMGMTGLHAAAPGNMGGLGVMGSNSTGMGMSIAMGPGHVNLHGSQSNGVPLNNPRYGGYGDSVGDRFQDDFDTIQHHSMIGRSGGASMGGQMSQPIGHMNNNGGFGGNGGYNISSPSEIKMRRPVNMQRRGDQMHDIDLPRQPDFYQGYSQQPQMMMQTLQGMNPQDMYSRGGSAPMSAQQDDYSQESAGSRIGHRPAAGLTGSLS